MRIACISMVKNEIDIIAAFLHACDLMFDQHMILDDMSTDGTYEYIQKHAKISGKITLLRMMTSGYPQAQVMNHFVKTEDSLRDVDWVFFLDTDEFLGCNSRAELE